MGQLTNSARMERTLGPRHPNWMAIVLLGMAGVLVAVGTVIALNAISTGNGAENQTMQPAYSRLDDYGLRHPAPLADPAAGGGRLDDYGLRHPTR